jgi:iron complex outermembrane receptor protein
MFKNALFLGVSLSILIGAAQNRALAVQDQAQEDEKNPPKKQKAPTRQSTTMTIEEVVVTGSPLNRTRFDVLQATAVLTGERLDEEMGTNLGDTLDHLPGISNSYFGPGAGRPVIRGLSGDRIRILIGGIGSIDASSTSPDHAVAGDPLTAQTIEVVRGPATLLYGNNAVGGVVNIRDGRIPHTRPDEKISGTMRGYYGSNSEEMSFAGTTDVDLSNGLVVHGDFSIRDAGNIKVPGFLESPQLRAAEEAEGLEEHSEEEEELYGLAPNTNMTAENFAFGVTKFFENGFFGGSLGWVNKNYGVPGHAHHEEEEEEIVRVDLDQFRYDFMGELNKDFLLFEKAKFRFGGADYEHIEMEGDEIGTTFLNKGWEGRLEFIQKEHNDLSGAFGIQMKKRDFEAIGDEAFVPQNTTNQIGVFALQEINSEHWNYEIGGRIENSEIKVPSANLKKSYTSLSLSGGASHLLSDDVLIGVTIHRTERAPNAEELFSFGPHLATQTYEIGDVNLRQEIATGGEVTLRKKGSGVTGSFTVFYNHYDNFIFQSFTGAIMDELPVAQFVSSDVKFWGSEAEANFEVYTSNDLTVNLDFIMDFVRATRSTSHTPLPRIPPMTIQGGVELLADKWRGRIEVEWAMAQKRIALEELPTDGFISLDASFTFKPFGEAKDIALSVYARNLLNQDIRYHTSFLKDILPAPGRDFRFSLKVGF